MTTDARPDLRALIEALPDFRDRDDSPWPWVSRRAVLALIPEGSVLVTHETLAAALHRVGKCLDVEGHCDNVEGADCLNPAWHRLDADDILAALTPEPTDD
jgi:hypothetical protein